MCVYFYSKVYFISDTHSHSGWTNFIPGVSMVAFCPRPSQHFLVFAFLVTAILSGERRNVNGVLICISLIATNVEYFSI